MVCPPLRARTFGSDAESVRSGTPAFERYAGDSSASAAVAGKIPAMRERAGAVDDVGGNIYHLERTTPTA